jgi:hypothetical protein
MYVAIFRKGRQVQEIRHDDGPVAGSVRRSAESAELTHKITVVFQMVPQVE